MSAITRFACFIVGILDWLGQFIAPLGLRLLLAWEFFTAGVEKYRGQNYFADLQGSFPYPINMLSPELNWQLAMWTELLASLLLVIGLGTRLSAFALLCVDLVAWYSVHAGHGYNVVDNGYQLPLMYAVMLVAVVLSGPGRLSVDSVLVRRFRPA